MSKNESKPFTISITISGYDAHDLQQKIVRQAAENLVGGWDEEEYEFTESTLAKKIYAEVVEHAKELAAEHIEQMVRDTMEAKVRTFDRWGEEKTSEPLREWVRDFAIKHAEGIVKKYDGGRPDYHTQNNQKCSRVEWIIQDTVGHKLDEVFADAVKDELTKIRARVKEIAAEAIAKHVK